MSSKKDLYDSHDPKSIYNMDPLLHIYYSTYFLLSERIHHIRFNHNIVRDSHELTFAFL